MSYGEAEDGQAEEPAKGSEVPSRNRTEGADPKVQEGDLGLDVPVELVGWIKTSLPLL